MPPATRIAARIDRFTGRTWLRPSLLDWLAQGEQPIFLFPSGPGAEKSAIASTGPACRHPDG